MIQIVCICKTIQKNLTNNILTGLKKEEEIMKISK